MKTFKDKVGKTNITYLVPNDFKFGESYFLDMILTASNGEKLQASVNIYKGWSESDLNEIITTSLHQLKKECISIEAMFKKTQKN